MKIATTKERILQYLDFKGISIANFLKETGIKRGFLDTDKLNAAVSDLFISKILATYGDIDLYWLITGKGSMICESGTYLVNKSVSKVEEPKQEIQLRDPISNELLQTQRDLISSQKEQLAYYKELIADLKKEQTSVVPGPTVHR